MKTKVKLKCTHDEVLHLNWILMDGLERLKPEHKQDRVRMMIMAVLMNVNIKMQRMLIVHKDNYTLTLSLFEAHAIWLAYEKGYIYAKPGLQYAQLILERKCNLIHQYTA